MTQSTFPAGPGSRPDGSDLSDSIFKQPVANLAATAIERLHADSQPMNDVLRQCSGGDGTRRIARRSRRFNIVIASASEAIHLATRGSMDGFVAIAPRNDGERRF
jgi:hypothetical protein